MSMRAAAEVRVDFRRPLRQDPLNIPGQWLGITSRGAFTQARVVTPIDIWNLSSPWSTRNERIMPKITKDEAVVTVINAFNVDPENQQRLIDLLARATEETISKMPGFISASFHKSVDGTRVVNYAQWATRQALEAMFTDPAARAHIEEARKLGVADYHLYEVYSVHRGDGSSTSQDSPGNREA
jgi:quinol monooxygenase YgiN